MSSFRISHNHRIAEKQNVDIDRARAFFLHALPAHLLFDAENRGHQLLRRLAGFKRDRTIQKPGLLGELHRLGFVERRNCRYATGRSQAC